MRRTLLLALAVALLPGCGALTPSAGGSSAKGPLQVWIMEPGNPELRSFFTSATTDFEAAHPGDRVAVQFVPWASAHDQFVTSIGGGQIPDVAEMGSTWTPEFGDIGALEPADLARGTGGAPPIPAAGAAKGRGEGDGAGGDGRFVASLVEGATVDGTVYGVPWYAGARALIYRTDVLSSLGLSVPTTWDELLTVGRAIRDRTGMAAFGVAGNAPHYVLPMVWQNGGEIAYRKGGVWRSGMESPEAVAAVQFYADLYRTEHFAPAGALSWNARDVRKAFEAGDLAMMIGGGWDLRPLLAAHPELAGKVGTALLPAGPAATGTASPAAAISSCSPAPRRRHWPAATSTTSSSLPGWPRSRRRSASSPAPATAWRQRPRQTRCTGRSPLSSSITPAPTRRRENGAASRPTASSRVRSNR